MEKTIKFNKSKRKTKSKIEPAKLPSIKEMQDFCKWYKDHWDKLTKNKQFLDVFCFDIQKAKEIADSILNEEENPEEESN